MENQNNYCIIFGGGQSIREGINLGLFEYIKDKEVWSINFAYKTMSFLPKREIWIDRSFFTNNITELQNLYKQGVKCYAKLHSKYADIPEITTYETTKIPQEYGNEKKVFVGTMGITGYFALSLAVREKYKTIYLLGYDFGLIEGETKTHYYQDELQVQSTGVGRPELYKAENNRNIIRPDVRDFDLYNSETSKIYNVSPKSNIKSFERINYLTFFEKIKEIL